MNVDQNRLLHRKLVRQHITMIITGLCPDAPDNEWDDAFDSMREELEQLSPELLERIAGCMSKYLSLAELVNQMVVWANEHKAEVK